MPYKSDAQRKKFHAMLARGEISAKVVEEYDQASKGKHLPEHVAKHQSGHPRRKGRKQRFGLI